MSVRITYDEPTVCPHCGVMNDAATPPGGGRGPQDGDFSICVSCGEWAIHAAGEPGGMRKPVFEEYWEIANDPEMRRMRDAWVVVAKQMADDDDAAPR